MLQPVAGDVGQLFLQVVIHGIGELFESEAAAAEPAAKKGLPSCSSNVQRPSAFGTAHAVTTCNTTVHGVILLCRGLMVHQNPKRQSN